MNEIKSSGNGNYVTKLVSKSNQPLVASELSEVEGLKTEKFVKESQFFSALYLHELEVQSSLLDEHQINLPPKSVKYRETKEVLKSMFSDLGLSTADELKDRKGFILKQANLKDIEGNVFTLEFYEQCVELTRKQTSYNFHRSLANSYTEKDKLVEVAAIELVAICKNLDLPHRVVGISKEKARAEAARKAFGIN